MEPDLAAARRVIEALGKQWPAAEEPSDDPAEQDTDELLRSYDAIVMEQVTNGENRAPLRFLPPSFHRTDFRDFLRGIVRDPTEAMRLSRHALARSPEHRPEPEGLGARMRLSMKAYWEGPRQGSVFDVVGEALASFKGGLFPRAELSLDARAFRVGRLCIATADVHHFEAVHTCATSPQHEAVERDRGFRRSGLGIRPGGDVPVALLRGEPSLSTGVSVPIRAVQALNEVLVQLREPMGYRDG